MAASSICVNQVVEISEIPYRLVERLPEDQWRVQNMTDRTHMVFEHAFLLEEYAAGRLTLRVDNQPTKDLQRKLGSKAPFLNTNSKGRKKPVKPISLPNGDQRTRERQREIDLEYAKRLKKLLDVANRFPLGSQIQEEALREEWQGIFGEPPPDKLPVKSTIHRWNKKLIESGGDVRGLAKRHHLKGRRYVPLAPQVAELVDEVVHDVYMTTQRKTIRDVYDALIPRVRAENVIRPADDHLIMPPFERVREFIFDIPAFDKTAARYGIEAARKKFRAVLKNIAPSRPLERVELDATRLDVIGVDDAGIPLGRPWLHICIDACTRVVLGFCISYEPPNLASLFACLRHALLPKPKALCEALGLNNPWPFYGAWERLVLDNGMENHSNALDALGSMWGMDIQFCPRRSPWYKARIERFLRTFNSEFCHSLPGSTFSNIFDRGDYQPVKEAVLHWKFIERLAAKYINDVYHRRTHRSLGTSPAAKWQALMPESEILLPCDPQEVSQVCRTSEVRALSHKGIESLGLYWNSEDLRSMRKQCGSDIDVRVYFDRFNLGSIGVQHPKTGAIVEVPSLCPQYTSGLSRYQHLVIRRFNKQRGANDDVLDYLEAKAEIAALVDEASRSCGYTSHGLAARFLAEQPATVAETANSSAPVEAPPKQKTRQSPSQQVPATAVTETTSTTSIDLFSIKNQSHGTVSVQDNSIPEVARRA